jgi:predicted RNA-binding protein associated with RNAse of E/G family
MSEEISLKISCEGVEISPNGYRSIDLDITAINSYSILEQFDIDTVIQFFTIDALLEKIGADECKEYFDLTDKTR